MIPRLVIHPDINQRQQYIEDFISKLGFKMDHPDLLWLGVSEKLGMEQAKKIKNFLKLKPYQAEGQLIVIVAAENLTTDAQNALLKTLEEHAEGVTFILGVASEDQLLPTLVSRCQSINLPNSSTSGIEQNYQEEIEKLLSSTTEQRFQFIEKLKERDEFLLSLTTYFRNLLLTNIKSLPRRQAGPRLDKKVVLHYLKDLVEAERWANQNVNIRAILEYLMLKMPKS